MAYRSLLGLFAAAAAAAAASPATVLETVAGGAFTFSLTGSVNYTVDTTDFWTGSYYVPPESKSAAVVTYDTPALAHETAGYVPMTVFVTDAKVVTKAVLSKLVANYTAYDDTYSTGFLGGVEIVFTAHNGSSLDASALTYLDGLGIRFLVLPKGFSSSAKNGTKVAFTTVTVSTNATHGAAVPPPGPYLANLSHGRLSLYKVYALFTDYQGAFYNGATPNDDGSYSAIGLWNAEHYAPLISVPPRLYTSLVDRSKYPLAGLRFALKDLMPVEGIVTTGGSRAYSRLYNTPANTTAPAIARLLGLGAVLLGKSKLTTFAFGAYPYQTQDYPYAWNIRGDGALGLSASSFGSAAAIAAYPQLDFAVGSDTLGSVRNPADRAGVFGIRPSWGAIDLTEVIPSATSMDTLGVMARSASMLHHVMGTWEEAEDTGNVTKGTFDLPTKIFYPVEWFPVNNSAAQTLIDGWLANMTKALGMTIVKQNVTKLFQEHVAPNNTLSNFTSNFGTLTSYDNWNLFGRTFVDDYKVRYDGRWPEADNQVLSAWASAEAMVPANKTSAESQMAVFRRFINTYVLPPSSTNTCSEGLFVYQIEDTGGGVPEYRDVLDYDYFPPFFPMRAASIAPFARLVDVTVPIGAIEYDSVISKVSEKRRAPKRGHFTNLFP